MFRIHLQFTLFYKYLILKPVYAKLTKRFQESEIPENKKEIIFGLYFRYLGQIKCLADKKIY